MAGRLGISRRLLHDWMKAWKAHGPEGVLARATVIQCPLIGKICRVTSIHARLMPVD
jgi:hypothetical protein